MPSPAIIIDGLSKSYRIQHQVERYPTFREALVRTATAPLRRLRQLSGRTNGDTAAEETFWALKDVSFEVQPGEVVGIIGRNGAGKSTLLKILSRITEPTSGQAILNGRVASLLEVGTGFHPELTGRENIYLNGAILGMRKAEIKRKFDEIVAFAEIEKFLDTPVKRYSSGMYVRLAFAVAAHLEPEILIVDEVLAVGDAEFQKKCLGKMQEVAHGQGRTVLFVSHNMAAVLSMCSIGLLIDGGRSTNRLDVQECVHRYLAVGVNRHSQVPVRLLPRFRQTPGPPLFVDMHIVSRSGKQNTIATGESLKIIIEVENRFSLKSLECGVILNNDRGQRVVAFQTRYHSGLVVDHFSNARFTCSIASLPLVPGTYFVDLVMSDGGGVLERVEQAGKLNVVFADLFGTGYLPNSSQGHIALPCTWTYTTSE